MNWVRAGASLVAISVHIAAASIFLLSTGYDHKTGAFQSSSGSDDLTVVATVTLQSEDSIGTDLVSTERQASSSAGEATPPAQRETDKKSDPVAKPEEAKIEEALKTESQPPQTTLPAPLTQEALAEKQTNLPPPQEVQPANPGVLAAAEDEQHAQSRNLEARRNQAFSLYNGEIYRAITRRALRPETRKKGRVVIELTLAPSGELLAHHVVESSGSDVLDRTAITSLERAAPFPSAPRELGQELHTLRVPFEYATR